MPIHKVLQQRLCLSSMTSLQRFNLLYCSPMMSRMSHQHVALISLLQKNFYNTQNEPFKIVNYKDIKNIIEHKDDSYIIDVREPKEVINGSIPTSKNVPMSQLMHAWSLSEKDFENQFGFHKPKKDAKITVYCQAGVRSTKVAEYLSSLGYKNLQNYVGSWADYIEHQKGGK
ncbi:Rhodanese-like domain-containing protein [Cokeromyces recurvatus]|uniref:Rhodanese-like domain-containing protein n=1 Tax=Cokeromyces recurvatus TaxID=90255 RepID=UPI00221F0C25|nr:Rhodanese-like domain-containing protein [Cokeromyces recurvatus]KAI7897598.1 Rhodanese-like domain-containing protein [Cokeromyces recurvatus]